MSDQQPSGQFGDRLRAWLNEVINLDGWLGVFGLTPGMALEEIGGRLRAAVSYIFGPGLLSPHPGMDAAAILTTGQEPEAAKKAEDALDFLKADPSGFIAAAISDGLARRGPAEVFQSLGALIYDTSVSLITGRSAPPGSEAADRARQFVGFVSALGAAPQVMAAIAEVASLGQIDKLGDNVAQIYYNLGLGFLTWQTMAPVLEAGILQPLERDVQRQWRGQRFSLGQLSDLFALGEISRGELLEELRSLGWRDEDIDRVIRLAYRTLSESRVLDLLHENLIQEPEAIDRLAALGYSAHDIGLILLLDRKADVQEDRRESISVLTNSFKEGMLPEAEFRSALDEQGYTDREIDLRIALVRLKQEADARQLTVTQLKKAWAENVVGDPEVRHRLEELGYDRDELEIILATWRAEGEPEFLRVNYNAILDMYRLAVYDRRQADQKLQAVGYSPEDARDLLDLTEARYPVDFGQPPNVRARLLSLGAVVDLYAMGRMDDAAVVRWAQESGFTQLDADNLLALVAERAREPARPLSQSTVEDAYVSGVLTRRESESALAELGFAADEQRVILNTVEAENPAVFDPETIRATRQPSITALVQAVINGLIAEMEYFEWAAKIGMTRAGAEVYLANARVTPGTKSKTLSKTDLLEAFRKFLIGYSEAHARLVALGYSYEDADLLLRMEQKGVEATDVWQVYLAGYLSQDDCIRSLVVLGFTPEEIGEAFMRLGS